MMSGRIPVRIAASVRGASRKRASSGLTERNSEAAGSAQDHALLDVARSTLGFFSTREYASSDKGVGSSERSSPSKAQLQSKEQPTRSDTGQSPPQKDASSVNEQQRNQSTSSNQKEPSVFPTTAKPDPARMWQAIGANPDYDEASSDAGGYIKRVDVGLDQAKVDAARRVMNERDERLRTAQERASAGSAPSKSSPEMQAKPDSSSTATQSSQIDGKKQDQSSEKGTTRELKGGEFITPDQDNEVSKKRTVSNAQQTVVMEGLSSQVSPDGGGLGQLSEQLLDRDGARSSLEAEKSVSTRKVGTASKKDSKKKKEEDEDTSSSSSSSSESDSDSEGRKREKRLKKQQKLKKQ
ncbi:hypothetical protein RvY_07567 [Ramazzottius varieornatus]|uniref:Uncharacterized protein n=1 Tax=Ramazzottius varieornatus TaxID=947166 RepID=A0A1D1VB28_RAMVA|nr:hypothetical protein RvY_07567 [Ramazzottius varieornatus]